MTNDPQKCLKLALCKVGHYKRIYEPTSRISAWRKVEQKWGMQTAVACCGKLDHPKCILGSGIIWDVL